MTTYYTQIPTLWMRARSAELVVVARIGPVIETAEEYHDGAPYVRTTFAVEIEEVLKGEAHGTRVSVEVLGGRTERAETSMPVTLPDGERMVLMLSDAGRTDVLVPYLGSAFILDGSRMLIGEHRAEKLGVAAENAPEHIELDELRRIVDDAVQDQAKKSTIKGPMQLQPVTERPDGHLAAGQPSAPEPPPADDAPPPTTTPENA